MVKPNARTVALLSLCLGLLVFAGQPALAKGPYGRRGGKKQQDPRVTVKKVVNKAIADYPGVGAALIRLVFHDCWVHGCDGSVLLDAVPTGGKTEKQAKNNIGLAGFDVIDNIKAKLGDDVSCADIVVLAARQATINLSRGKINYDVTTGRKDGVFSSAEYADEVLPHTTSDITQLKNNFLAKGFNTTELTTLSGAHSIGFSHRSSFQDRLDNDTATPIDGRYLQALRKDVESKTTAAVPDPIEPLNIRDMEKSFRKEARYDPTGVNTKVRGVLDNSYYHANLQNMVLLESDWVLLTDEDSKTDIKTFKSNAKKWYRQFGSAMAKLSDLKAKGPRVEEIRKKCREINTKIY